MAPLDPVPTVLQAKMLILNKNELVSGILGNAQLEQDQRVLLSPFVQGIVGVAPDGTIQSLLDPTSRVFKMALVDLSAGETDLATRIKNLVQASPYASDGGDVFSGSAEIDDIKTASIQVAVANDGSIAATTLIAAAVGVKHIIYDLYVGLGSTSVAAMAGDYSNVACNIAISDGIGYAGTGAPLLGPKKQSTANTAIQVSAAAGRCSVTAVGAPYVTITCRYRISS